ncbi:MAG: (deoxy)nucleoside triphosphate pyrophosphohydrolase [Terriglobales bacterium]
MSHEAGPTTTVVAGIVRRQGTILICQRRREAAHALEWEFPGGKLEPGETEPAGLARELREELGIAAEVGKLAARLRHRYPGGEELELAFYEVPSFAGAPQNRVFEAIAWVRPSELGRYPFLAADRPLLARLAKC